MKKTIFLIAVFFATCFNYQANAQIHFNIGIQPLWGPVGYDYVNYYYIPDLDVYYDVPNQAYVYYDDGRWVSSAYLPSRFGNVDLYRYHKVVINEPTPWFHHDRYRDRYAIYRGHYDQHPIRDSRDEHYWANPGHPHHEEWHGRGQEFHQEGHREWQGGNRGGWQGGNRGGWHGGGEGGHENHGHEEHGHEEHGHGENGHGEHGHH
jgi:hypothetical protein